MNTKRIIFWAIFIIIFGLIVWGMIVASNKPVDSGFIKGEPMLISDTDHVKGAQDAPVTLIEYSDFECSACQNQYFIIDKLLKEASSTVKFVYRHYPLPQHTKAIPAAMATEAAGQQGKFWEMYDLVFSNYADWSVPSVNVQQANVLYRGYAQKIGLDLVKYEKDLTDSTLKAKVLGDKSDGERIGVNSTPTFFINGKVIPTPSSYAEFKKLIDNFASSTISI